MAELRVASEPALDQVHRAELQELRSLFGRDWSKMALAMAGWTVLAVTGTTTAFISMQGDDLGLWLRIFQRMIVYYCVWALIAPFVYRLVVAYPFTAWRAPGLVLLHGGCFVVIAGVIPFVAHGDEWREWLFGQYAVGAHTLSAFTYISLVVGSLLLKYYRLSLIRERKAKEMALRASMLEHQLSVAKIDTLKMQLNPHFLFNALNSIAALIETSNNAEAYRTTELLGGLLRSALDQSRQNLMPLAEELKFVERYVDIEKVRFGDRLGFRSHVAADCLQEPIPTLLLQPIVENSIKHAVAPSNGPIMIEIRATRSDSVLTLEVTDDGPGLQSTAAHGSGYGLLNIEQRLELLFGTDYGFEIKNRRPTGVSVVVQIPRATGIEPAGGRVSKKQHHSGQSLCGRLDFYARNN